MIGGALRLQERCAVDDHGERRVADRPVQATKDGAQHAGEIPLLRLAGVLEPGRVPARKEPRLKREARGEGRQREHVLALDDEAGALLELLAGDVAEEAPLSG